MKTEWGDALECEIDQAMDQAEMRMGFILSTDGEALTDDQKAKHADALLISSSILSLVKKMDSVEEQLHRIALYMPE